jgi:hypothetical protein
MKPKKSKIEELVAKYKPESLGPAKEVLDYLYRTILATPEFTLQDGTKARVDRYYGPEVDDDGQLTCGVDVHLDNGTDLEFTVNNTGWGKFVADHAYRKGKRERRR